MCRKNPATLRIVKKVRLIIKLPSMAAMGSQGRSRQVRANLRSTATAGVQKPAHETTWATSPRHLSNLIYDAIRRD
jgi:hypothetical protein